jgi:hypothetical protein
VYAFIKYLKDLGIFMCPLSEALCSQGWGLNFEWKTERKNILKCLELGERKILKLMLEI